MVYFDANRNNLRRQVRQGIAGILVQNLLFGDDLGEFAANQTLLDLPQWLTEGYIQYAAETWSTDLDDQLKAAMLQGEYKNFYHFAFEKPHLAGHSFWYYFGNKYGRNKTTYLLYLARVYRNLNSGTQRIASKKFKEILKDFMTDMTQLYYKDIRGRRNVPKGQLSIAAETGKKDFIRFNANPQPRSFTYAVTEFRGGRYTVVVNENFVNRKELLNIGIRSRQDEVNPNYPILAWDGKGTRLAVLYSDEGKIKFFIYDAVNRVKIMKQEWPMFDQVQDMKYMLDANTLLVSAVKSGQTDIFVYKIDKQTVEQITNDRFDDLDPSFVAFPNKTGIIFSSNRPSPNAIDSDTSMPSEHFNIFLVDNWNKSEFKQVSQLTNVKQGNARFPSQYNVMHFTFVSDESGINNRFAGFFTTEKAGLDTLIFIGDEVLRNPDKKEVDSLLKEWNKTDIDSVGYFATSNDSAYVFPLSNYQNSLIETRTAGDQQQVSEVIRQADYKFLYRLRVDEATLRRRNVTARPTEYRKKTIEQKRLEDNKAGADRDPADTTGNTEDIFQTGFEDEKDSTQLGKVVEGEPLGEEPVLKRAKLYEYRPPRFFNDYLVAGVNNTTFSVNRYQPYMGGAGPIEPSTGSDFNGLIRMGTIDFFEDYKLSGGIRINPNLRDNDVLFEFMNIRRKIDWGVTYYRSSRTYVDTSQGEALAREYNNYYFGRLRFAFDRVKSLRITIGPRFDNIVYLTDKNLGQSSLVRAPKKRTFGQLTMEYVYDNSLNKTLNIWEGLKWKVYGDWFTQLSELSKVEGKYIFNAGYDARHSLKIYRNAIWAVRSAADFSWGNQKVVYYLGGVDGWLKLRSNEKFDPTNPVAPAGYRYFDPTNRPDPGEHYAYQALAVNMRGFKQNVANGSNAFVLNSEIRVPVFTTFLNRPINNALLRNFQVVQFVDLGTAWNGKYDEFKRPSVNYTQQGSPVTVQIKAGGIGPFAGGYGFGARSTLFGYFIRYDAAWQMNGFFRGKPQMYLAMGLDF
jgi:hypothetical protein